VNAPPKNDKADVASAGRVEEQDTAIIDHAGRVSEQAANLPVGDERKAFENTRALAAFKRCTLYELASGGFLLCQAGVARELPDLRAVGDLLRQIGAVR
jgi:hypothetical protein